MRINHNLASLNTYRQLSTNSANGQKSLEKLSSGLRINKAGDDAAGLAISEKMRGQIRGLDQAARNSQDGISLIQTAEGALTETHSILQRMRELAVQSANDTSTTTDRGAIQTEITQLKSEVDRISSTTEFNTKKLLDGSITSAVTAQETKLESLTLKAFARQGSTVTTCAAVAACINACTITINGVSVTLTVTCDDITNTAGEIASSINNTSGIGVTAVVCGDAVSLVAKTAGQAVNVSGTCAETLNYAFRAGSGCTTLAITTSAALTTSTQLRDLADANGNQLGMAANDVVSASIMVGGTTAQNGSYTVAAVDTTLATWLADVNADVAGIQTDGSVTTTGDIEFQGCAGLTNALSALKFTISGKTNFNNTFSAFAETQAAKDAAFDSSLSFHIGANRDQTMSVGMSEISVRSLSLTGVDVSTRQGGEVGVEVLDRAIQTVSSERSKLGAYQNRLEHTIAQLGTTSENVTAAESRIRDVDMAKEMMEFTKNNILTQAAQAMLAQANQAPQGVLQLLR